MAFCVFCTSHLLYVRDMDFESEYRLVKSCRYHSHVPHKHKHGKSKKLPKALDVAQALLRGKINNVIYHRVDLSCFASSPTDLLNGL